MQKEVSTTSKEESTTFQEDEVSEQNAQDVHIHVERGDNTSTTITCNNETDALQKDVSSTTSEIYVLMTNNDSGRKYDKPSYCKFCYQRQCNLLRQ